MDVGALYNSITLSVSLTALAMSSVLTVRQLRTARTASQDANITQALLCLNGEYRSDEFRESEDFVREPGFPRDEGRQAAGARQTKLVTGPRWPSVG
jgi:hypothetical protein